MKSEITEESWRFWTVLILAFLYPINNALISIAIPIYFFQIGLSIEIIGFITAGTALTYMISPLLFRKISERLGRRKSILFASIGVVINQSVFYITLDPMVFYLCRITEGLLMGFYWPSMQASISDNTLHDHSRMMSRYNMAWNGGIVIGYLLGAIFLYVIDIVYVIFYIAPVFIMVNLLIGIMFYEEPNKINLEQSLGIRESNQERYCERSDITLTGYCIPVIIPVLFILTFTAIKGSVLFLYPLKSEMLGFASFTVYLQVLFCVSMQLIGTAVATYFSIKNLKRVPLIFIAILGVCVLIFGLNTNFIVFLILFVIIGFGCGLLYGFALKFVMILNMKDNTSKYSSYLESLIGGGFMLTPIICGFIAMVDLNLAFFLIFIVILVFLVPCIVYTMKINILKNSEQEKSGAHSGI